MNQLQNVFGSGKEKIARVLAFNNSTSVYEKLITKEIESYGILKLTE